MAEIALGTVSVSCLGKVFKGVRAINQAVATDRRNRKEYRGIVRSVNRVSSIMFCLQGARELTMHPVMTNVLDDLAGSLDEALELIERCKGRNIIHGVFVAKHTAKELSRVKNDIEHKLLMGIFAGMMQIFTLNNTIQLPQGCQNTRHISMLLIMVDLDCYRCRNKICVILCKLQEQEMAILTKVVYDTNKVIITGSFDPLSLSHIIPRKGRNVVKDIKIVEEEEPVAVEGTDPRSPPHDEGIHLSSTLDERPPTRDDDGSHTSMASEGPWSLPAAGEHPALLEGIEASPQTQRPFSLGIPWEWDRIFGHDTTHKTRDEAPAAFCHQLDEGDKSPAIIAPQPRRTNCPFGCKDVMILVQATVIIILMWYLM